MANIEYSASGPESLNEIKPLWEKLNQLHSTLSPHFGDLASLRTFEARKNELQEKGLNGSLRIDLAKDNATVRVIGYIIATLSKAGAGEIDSIFVEESYRGTGVADTLMKRALAWLDENRARTKTIVVATGNEHVHGFYRRFGFYPRVTTLMQKV